MSQESILFRTIKKQAKILHHCLKIQRLQHEDFNLEQAPTTLPTLQQCQEVLSKAYGYRTFNGVRHDNSQYRLFKATIFRDEIAMAMEKALDFERLEFFEATYQSRPHMEGWKVAEIDDIMQTYDYASDLPYYDLWYLPNKWYSGLIGFDYAGRTWNKSMSSHGYGTPLYEPDKIVKSLAVYGIRGQMHSVFIQNIKNVRKVGDTAERQFISFPVSTLLNAKKIADSDLNLVEKKLIEIAELFCGSHDMQFEALDFNSDNFADSQIRAALTKPHYEATQAAGRFFETLNKREVALQDWLKDQDKAVIDFKSEANLEGINCPRYYSIKYFFYLAMGLNKGGCDQVNPSVNPNDEESIDVFTKLLADDTFFASRFALFKSWLPLMHEYNTAIDGLRKKLSQINVTIPYVNTAYSKDYIERCDDEVEELVGEHGNLIIETIDVMRQ